MVAALADHWQKPPHVLGLLRLAILAPIVGSIELRLSGKALIAGRRFFGFTVRRAFAMVESLVLLGQT